MRKIGLTLLLVAAGCARANGPAARTPEPAAKVIAPVEQRIVPNGPYPVLFSIADAAAQTKFRTAFIKANPGWQANLHPSGSFVTSNPPAPVTALGTESGARTFLQANAATLGLDPAVLDHPSVHGDQITFGTSKWGRWTLGGFTVSPASASGVLLGSLGTPPRELDDETLTRLVVGRRYDFQVTMQPIVHPCDPGPDRSGCPSGASEPTTGRESILVERTHIRKIERRLLGVSRPHDPTRWELRIVASFSMDLAHGRCNEPYTGPNDMTRLQCRYQLEVDGKPGWGLVLDAVTGEPLFDRSLVIQLSSVISSRP